jgi:hypothetical protein
MPANTEIELKKLTSTLTPFGVFLNNVEDAEVRKAIKSRILESRFIWLPSKEMKTRKSILKNWRYQNMGAPDTMAMAVVFGIVRIYFPDTHITELFEIRDAFDREFIVDLSNFLLKSRNHVSS